MTTFLMVRHGQSEWNALGRWQGQADVALTELGRHQALAAASAVGMVDAIVASDLERAAMSAAIISEQIGVGPVITDERFRERHAGSWQGLTRAEIEQQYPGFLDAHQRPDDYETDDEVLERVVPALVEWTQAGESVLVVTHAGVILAVERMLDDRPVERLANLGGRYVHVSDDGTLKLGERTVLIDPDQVTVPGVL